MKGLRNEHHALSLFKAPWCLKLHCSSPNPSLSALEIIQTWQMLACPPMRCREQPNLGHRRANLARPSTGTRRTRSLLQT